MHQSHLTLAGDREEDEEERGDDDENKPFNVEAEANKRKVMGSNVLGKRLAYIVDTRQTFL